MESNFLHFKKFCLCVFFIGVLQLYILALISDPLVEVEIIKKFNNYELIPIVMVGVYYIASIRAPYIEVLSYYYIWMSCHLQGLFFASMFSVIL